MEMKVKAEMVEVVKMENNEIKVILILCIK